MNKPGETYFCSTCKKTRKLGTEKNACIKARHEIDRNSQQYYEEIEREAARKWLEEMTWGMPHIDSYMGRMYQP